VEEEKESRQPVEISGAENKAALNGTFIVLKFKVG
jgi:hypothetical protein